ncbi:MAG: methyltransferase domain-containing protein [Phycisphaerae bacterium]|nr:methyltransferase domain-containing protein [Phycisphaerae bacterium]
MSDANSILQRFYRWNAPIYDLTRWAILRGREAALDALCLTAGDRVLEVGCGTGLNLVRIAGRVGEHGCVVGVDISCHMLARARRRRRGNIYLIQADAARLALRMRFDAVLMSYSLTMIPDWRGALQQACDLLKPGGIIVVLDFAECDCRGFWFGPWFDRYLARNHVNTHRDLEGVLARQTSKVEKLSQVPAYVTLLRGTAVGRVPPAVTC